MALDAVKRPAVAGLTFDWERWRKPLLLGYVVLNIALIARLLTWPEWHGSPDWAYWTLLDDNPYTYIPGVQGYRYSPVAFWIFRPIAEIAGAYGFVLLHLALLLTLPRRLGLLVAVSFPFWADLMFGNVFTLVFVAAYHATQGNRWASLGFLGLTLLMPRPVQLPLAAWLLWYQPWVRVPFVLLFLGHAGLVMASGYWDLWLARLLDAGGREMALASNLSPSRFLGMGWLVIGVPLSLVLWRRYPAWAGLAFAPYLIPQYWLMVAVTPRRSTPGGTGRRPTTRLPGTTR